MDSPLSPPSLAIPGPHGSTTPGQRHINFVWYNTYPEGPNLEKVMTDKGVSQLLCQADSI